MSSPPFPPPAAATLVPLFVRPSVGQSLGLSDFPSGTAPSTDWGGLGFRRANLVRSLSRLVSFAGSLSKESSVRDMMSYLAEAPAEGSSDNRLFK